MALTDKLTAIADAIRAKSGKTDKLSLSQMVTEIGALKTSFKTQAKSVTLSETAQSIKPDSTYDGLSSVSVPGISSTYVGSAVTRQAAKTVSPTRSAQTVVKSGVYTTGDVKVGAIPSDYIIPDDTYNITANGTYDITEYAEVSVNVPTGGKNIQAYHGYASVSATAYTATAVSLTVAKSGTYKVSWMGWRSTNSGTSGSQLYIGSTAYGSANTSFTNTYGQSVVLNNVSLTAGQVVTVRARARSTSYVMAVGNLIIEEV